MAAMAVYSRQQSMASLCLLEFHDRPRLPREHLELHAAFGARPEPEPADRSGPASALLDQTERELNAYFAGELRVFTVPLITPGTPFQRRVWDALRDIPFGATTSYGRLAASIGSPAAARAVGAANGANRIAILVPCHRVIDARGGLHGYGGGLARKKRLLDHEAAASSPSLFSGPAPARPASVG